MKTRREIYWEVIKITFKILAMLLAALGICLGIAFMITWNPWAGVPMIIIAMIVIVAEVCVHVEREES